MSWAVQSTQIRECTTENKWKLAQYIAPEANKETFEKIIKEILDGIIQELQKKFKLDNSIKEKLWNTVSHKDLESLVDTYICQICKKILGGFNDDEASVILKEYERVGFIENFIHRSRIKNSRELYLTSITNAVYQQAINISSRWTPEIEKALDKDTIGLKK